MVSVTLGSRSLFLLLLIFVHTVVSYLDETTSSLFIQMVRFLSALGFVVAFGTMFWFGLRRAFGRQTAGLIQSGPYRWSRNPQILGGYLLVIGTVVQRPSFYALGWVLLYGIIAQMMIVTEEEYLQIQYGEAYDQYCAHVPRYLRILQ